MAYLSYRQLQLALKSFREEGITLEVKLNKCYEVLHAEYVRITGEAATCGDYEDNTQDYEWSYRQTQMALKALREQGIKLQVKLNQCHADLAAEYSRLSQLGYC
jgi:hypothetical protein